MKTEDKGWARLKSAYGNSLRGLSATWQNEEAFRLECYLLLAALPVSFWIADTVIEWLMLIGSLLIVMITELLNTSVESAIDRVGEDFHPISGMAKDQASAAVLVSLLLAGMVWLALFIF